MFAFDFGCLVDRGLVRKSNQDVARVVPGLRLALVADGMGGHDHGDIASRAAAEALERSLWRSIGSGASVGEVQQSMHVAFTEANRQLADHPAMHEGHLGMGTTMVAAVFTSDRVVIGNVGDSRAYRLRNGSLQRLTVDHSYGQELRDAGASRTAQGKEIVDKWAHVLTRCLNGNDEVAADTNVSSCRVGDVYVLCSDGLWGSSDDDVIAAILGSAPDAQEACERLVGAAWSGGGLDNIGVAVVRLVPHYAHLDKPPGREPEHRREQTLGE